MTKPTRLTFSTSNARLKFEAAAPAPAGTPTASGDPNSIGTVRGYAITWNTLSTTRFDAKGQPYLVRLMPNSANFTAPTLALVQHQFTQIVGNSTAGTLKILPADEIGVPVEIQLPDTSYGRDTAVSIARGDIGGMSFSMTRGFEKAFDTNENGSRIVNAQEYTVDEVTITAIPAFTSTTLEIDQEENEADDTAEDAEIIPAIMQERISQSSKQNMNRLFLLRQSIATDN